MDDKPSRRKPSEARAAIAANVNYLMQNYREGFDRLGITSRQLEKKIGVSYKTLDRLLNVYADTGPSLDTLDAIAAFFGVRTFQLLQPHTIAAKQQGNPIPFRRQALSRR